MVALVSSRALEVTDTGVIGLRNFDEGVIRTLGGILKEYTTEDGGTLENYFIYPSDFVATNPITRSTTAAPPGYPGVPCNWNYPEDRWDTLVTPCFVVNRGSISLAMSRWHPGSVQYRVPARGTQTTEEQIGPIPRLFRGPLKVRERQQAAPYDIMYTISMLAARRGGPSRAMADAMLFHVMQVYQPYSKVYVRDSNNARRIYSVFQESISGMDEVVDVTGRLVGHSVEIRVEAEIDSIPEDVFTTARSVACTLSQK